MKIALQQLEQQLNKNLASIYIVSSDELLLVQEAAELIRHAAQKAGFTERTLVSIDSGSDWSSILYAQTHNISLFAEKKLIEINLHNAKFAATTTKALQEYAAHPQHDVILIIRTNKVDSKTEKSVWFKTLENNSVFISIWPIPAAQLPLWIIQRAKKQGLTLSKNTADLLANQVEGNLLAAAQEIEKINLLTCATDKNQKPLTTENNPTDHARFNIFDLVDSMIIGSHSRSLRILQNLAAEDTEPTLILWALTREFRMLADMMNQMNQGITLSSLFNKFRIFEKRQASIRTFLQRNTLEKCWQLLLHSANIDKIIKGAEIGSVWNEFETIIMLLSTPSITIQQPKSVRV